MKFKLLEHLKKMDKNNRKLSILTFIIIILLAILIGLNIFYIKDYNNKYRYISISDITDDNENNVEACNMDSIEGMRFSDILNMQVVDKKGIKIGIIEEAILDDRYNPQEYGIASKLDNKDLAEVINGVVNDMKSSGQMDELIQKWGIK